ncbi:hypothetical protein OEZ85_009564 [Tetradesmus obliquus]|uniref:CSC1/OSCA1-like cytosolic domain-containing protein n=1 Tax=Tetradesmus obliquus TaxID=3088 RepID=A0ABY8UBS6_TETOB|nr:hypothetical protein OEZ85_009564 [Tetradesmus obliquus]
MSCCSSSAAGVLPAEDVTRRYGKWRAPDEDKAKLYHRTQHAHHDFFDLWSSRVRDLKEFGVGHMMYFYFLRWMAVLFALLTIITAVPNMALNYTGKYYDTGQMELLSLGNFGRVSVVHNGDGAAHLYSNTSLEVGWERELLTATTFIADAELPPATHPINKAHALAAMSLLDCFSVALYFAVTLLIIWKARKLAYDADMHTVTIHDYSIHVERLPQDATADELVDFFGQYGEVVHVEVVRAYGRLVRLVLQHGQLLRQLQGATAALQREAQLWEEVPVAKEAACYRFKEEIDRISQEIEAEQSQADSHRVVGAFVTFKDEAGKLACLKAQPHSRMRQWWSLKQQHKLRGRHALDVTGAPEPSDVQYENMEHGGFDRFLRAALVAACSYSALAVGFVLISLASAMRYNLPQVAGLSSSSCGEGCRLADATGALSLTDADRELYKACTTGTAPNGTACSEEESSCYKCFCYKAISNGMLSESVYCSGLAGLLVLQAGSQVATVLVILIINSLLAYSSRLLTVCEKHHTRSSEARSLAWKLFMAQFLNSAVSTIIANAHLPFLAHALDGTAADGLFFQGIYTDLTPNWYKVVGRSLVISQFVAALLRATNLPTRWLTVKWRYWHRAECLTQHQLQESLQGPEFTLDQRYGEHLNVIYVSMLLSGGMPICYMTAAFWFATAYWCDKAELLSVSRRPITYSADLSNMVLNLLPFAAVLHMGFALWAFSIFGVPRSAIITDAFAALVLRICTATSVVWANAGSMTPQQAAQRLLAGGSAHLLVAAIVIVGVLFLKVTLSNWIKSGRWLLNMAGAIEDNEEAELSGVPEFPVAVHTQLLVGEASYAIQEQPSYAAAFARTEDAVEDVLVQVVMKRGAEKLAGNDAKAGLKQLSPRQARANQILPIAPEYLAAARAADNSAAAGDGEER